MNDNEFINNINEYFKNVEKIKLNIYFVKWYDYLPYCLTIEEIKGSHQNNFGGIFFLVK